MKDTGLKHTPGPWEPKVEASSGYRVLAKDKRQTIVCEVSGSASNPVSEADANLIAAAPTMLKEILETMDRLNALLAQPKYTKDDDLASALGTMHMDLNRVAAIADGSWPRS